MSASSLPGRGSKAEQRSRIPTTLVDAQGIPVTGDLIDEDDGLAMVDEAALHKSGASNQIICPDPSAHSSSQISKRSQMSPVKDTAKMNSARAGGTLPMSPLDKEGKLSSAGAATSLKHARASDLPSFPVVGIDRQSAAGAAASLGFASQKPFEHWRPDASAHAGKAALLAHDYKMKPLWQPELSAAGSKAALLAHQTGPNLNLWEPEASKEGNSAAGIALRNRQLSPKLDYGYTADGRRSALVAATGAVGRSRSGSTPTPSRPLYPDAQNAPYNALNAATIAHKPRTKSVSEDANLLSSDAMQSARVTHYADNVSREMFTEHPPVELEVEEQRRKDALRGASLSMAKQMYAMQQQAIEEAVAADEGFDAGRSAASVVGKRQSTASTRTPDIKEQAMQYIHLQETAQKLAADRLAKIDAEDHSAYRRHYGFHVEPGRSRLSIRGRNTTRRSSSEGKRTSTTADDDEFTSRRIRHQMSEFQDQIKQVDAKKRQQDRQNLLAAAERSVQSQLHAMDQRVFADTGKVSPAMLEEWESKARAKAAKESESRLQNHGNALVDVGGGKMLSQSEIEKIAAERVRPTLEGVNYEAEQHRARDEEMRLDAEEKKRQAQKEKDRERDLKLELKKAKDEEKRTAKARKDEEKQAARAEKQAKKDEKQKAKEIKKDPAVTTEVAGGAEPAVTASYGEEPRAALPGEGNQAEDDQVEEPRQATDTSVPTSSGMLSPMTVEPAAPKPAPPPIIPVTLPSKGEKPEATTPTSPTKSSGFKGLFSKLHRRSKSTNEPKQPGLITKITHTTHDAAAADDDEENTSPGVTTNTATATASEALPSEPRVSQDASAHTQDYISELAEPDPGSASAATAAAAAAAAADADEELEAQSAGVSELSAESEEARDGFNEALAPAPHFASLGKKGTESPVRETRFREEV